MKWVTYSKNFIQQATNQKKDSDYIKRCLEYAKILYDKNVPIIYNQKHFCLLVGFNQEYVHRISNSPEHFYRRFKIKKNNGKTRNIDEPLPDLKIIQKWILKEILNNIPVSPYAKAYISGRSIKENSRFHRGQKFVLTIDIKDFFPSITIFQVIKAFEDMGYSKSVSVFLANLCCLNNCLPQGAPTSPALSNIVTNNLDIQLSSLARDNKFRYTRYADDITLSGESISKHTINYIRTILKSSGFNINTQKTRILHRSTRQEVTGIVVNDKLQAPREIRYKLRQDIYFIKKYGLNSHLDKILEKRKNYIKHLLGIANFIIYINPKDNKVRDYIVFLKSLEALRN